MAVSVRIEDEAFGDRRYDVLARILGLPDADCARGKMAAVWRQCTQQQTHVLNAEMVCEILGDNGPDALIKSTLGELVEGGIRICGTKGRIEWLAKLRKSARKGGVARASQKASQMAKQDAAKRVANSCDDSQPKLSAPAPAPAPAQEERGSPPLALASDTPKPQKAGRQAKPQVHPDRARVIDAFHQRFKASYGTKPTWDSKTVGQVGDLLKKHSGDVLIARINFMFDGRAKWPPGPYSIDVFVANIDRWVEDQSASPATEPQVRKIKEL